MKLNETTKDATDPNKTLTTNLTAQPTSLFGNTSAGGFGISTNPTTTVTQASTPAFSQSNSIFGTTTTTASNTAAVQQPLTSTANKSTPFNLSFGNNSINLGSGNTQPNATQSTIPVQTTSITSTLASSQPTSTLTQTTSATNTQQQQNQQPVQMTFKQLEGYINVWLNELNQMESDFQTQSQTINSWDSLLVSNALKITNVNESLDLLKEEHKRTEQQLDFVISQQNELEQLLEPLEKIQIDFNINDTASTEREFTYSLVETVSNDLQSIGTELQGFIKKLNESKANQDVNDPLSSINKILNSHMDVLQYIEHQINVLKRNVET